MRKRKGTALGGPLFLSDLYLQLLEKQLQTELDVARAARAEYGIVTLHIRRRAGTTELARRARSRPQNCGGTAKSARLNKLKNSARNVPSTVLKPPLLADRKIYVVVIRYTEPVAARIAYSSQSRGRQKPTALRVTAIIRECSIGQRHELGIPSVRNFCGALACCRGGASLKSGIDCGPALNAEVDPL